MTDATTPEQPRTAAGQKIARLLAQGINPQWEGLRDYDNDQYTYAKHLIAQVEHEAQARPAVASEGLPDEGLVAKVLASMYHTPIEVVTDEVTASARMFVRRYAQHAALASDAGSVGALDVEAANLSQRITDAVNAGERPVSDMDFASILHGYAHQVADDRDDAADAERQGES